MKVKLNALQLKMIAIITMFIDHFNSAVVLTGIYLQRLAYHPWYALYTVVNSLTRISFLLFIFLQVESFFYTSSKEKYLFRLLLFAFISQPAYNMLLSTNAATIHDGWTLGALLSFSRLNIFFTLSLSFICIWICDVLLKSDTNHIKYASAAIVTFLLSWFSNKIGCSYSYSGVVASMLAYLAKRRNNKCLEGALISLTLGLKHLASMNFVFTYQSFIQFWAVLGIIPIMAYSGEKGKKVNKWLFYLFYPFHLIFISLLARIIWS